MSIGQPTHLKSLHRLIYVSEANGFAAAQARDVMASILEAAVKRNTLAGVSGALLAYEQWFLQVLEGSRLKVGEVYGVVCNDTRHRDIRVIEAKPVNRRLFGDWGMCGETLSAKDAEIVRLLGTRKRFDPATLTPTSAIKLLSVVRDIQSRGATAYV